MSQSNLLSRIFSPAAHCSTKQRRRTIQRPKELRRLGLECLEGRDMLAATISRTGGELTITADPAGGQIIVTDLNPGNISGLPPVLLVQTTSPNGNWAASYPKSGVNTVKLIGSNQVDRLELHSSIPGIIEGWGGADTLVGGSSADRILGGAGDDHISGYGGNDTLEGGGGMDYLLGGAGNDVLLGGAERDFIYGEADHDYLDGGEGHDYLSGGAGMDGLYGGAGEDSLLGGADPDRFLIRTNETGRYAQVFGGNTIMVADLIVDDTAQDIRVRFTDEGARTVTWGPGVFPSSTSYTAGSWTDAEIQLVDQALAAVAKGTANNALLYNSLGGEPQLFRLGNASNQYIAFNDSATGDTHYSNQSFTWNGVFNADWATQVVLHEFGHNWDTRPEADRLLRIWGAVTVTQFRDQSGWTQTPPIDVTNFTQSRDGQWWYASSAQFVRWYAQTNPREDFAETFSAYFMQQEGRAFVGGPGAAGAPGKVTEIGNWVSLVKSLGPEGRPVGGGGTGGPLGSPSAMASGVDFAAPAANLLPLAELDGKPAARKSSEITRTLELRNPQGYGRAGALPVIPILSSCAPEVIAVDSYFARHAHASPISDDLLDLLLARHDGVLTSLAAR